MVVGAGPVGLVVAALLGQRGRRVCVMDRQAQPYPLPRAVHLDGEAARILQSVGVADEAGEWTEPLDAYEWRNKAGDVLLRLDAEGTPGPYGWPVSVMFSQPDLERRLTGMLATSTSVETYRGFEVVSIDRGPLAVGVTARGPDGTPQLVEAAWLVGCDGAASTVRAAADIAMEDLEYFYDWLIVDVIPDELGMWRPMNIQVCDPHRPTTAVSGGPGRRRWEFMRLPGEPVAQLASAGAAWRLLGPWGITPANATLERHALYTFSARLAKAWRQGRVLLAGDAAHQMPPFAGQGMCSGIRDAANLAWKLDLVLAGGAAEDLLDSYQTEREPNVRSLIDLSIELGRIICVPDPVDAATRDEQMIPAAVESGPVPMPPSPPVGPGVLADGDACAGQAWIQGRVAYAGCLGRFDDVVGRGWVLLAVGDDPVEALSDDDATWLASVGGFTAGIGPAGPDPAGHATAGQATAGGGCVVADVDGTYRAWMAQAGVVAVLVRPDFIIFGGAARPADVAGLVTAARRRIAVDP